MASDSSWLLFIDADTFISSDIVSKSVLLAETKRLDAVTCFGGLRCRGSWDKIAVPFYFALLNSFVKFGGNKQGNGAYFIGSFILIKRSEYFRIGGHAAVAGELVEDKALSDAAIKFGLSIGMTYAPKLVSTEWAPGFKNGTQALSREILPSIRHKPFAAVAFASALTLLFTLPLVSIIISLQPHVPFRTEFLGLGIVCISLSHNVNFCRTYHATEEETSSLLFSVRASRDSFPVRYLGECFENLCKTSGHLAWKTL